MAVSQQWMVSSIFSWSLVWPVWVVWQRRYLCWLKVDIRLKHITRSHNTRFVGDNRFDHFGGANFNDGIHGHHVHQLWWWCDRFDFDNLLGAGFRWTDDCFQMIVVILIVGMIGCRFDCTLRDSVINGSIQFHWMLDDDRLSRYRDNWMCYWRCCCCRRRRRRHGRYLMMFLTRPYIGWILSRFACRRGGMICGRRFAMFITMLRRFVWWRAMMAITAVFLLATRMCTCCCCCWRRRMDFVATAARTSFTMFRLLHNQFAHINFRFIRFLVVDLNGTLIGMLLLMVIVNWWFWEFRWLLRSSIMRSFNWCR